MNLLISHGVVVTSAELVIFSENKVVLILLAHDLKFVDDFDVVLGTNSLVKNVGKVQKSSKTCKCKT